MAARESQASREIVTPLYGTFPCVSCPPVDYRKVTRKPPVFDTAANLRNHCRRFHDPSYCSVCWASFPGYDGLNKHRKLGCEPSVRVRNGAKVNKDGNGRRSESTGSSSSSEDEDVLEVDKPLTSERRTITGPSSLKNGLKITQPRKLLPLPPPPPNPAEDDESDSISSSGSDVQIIEERLIATEDESDSEDDSDDEISKLSLDAVPPSQFLEAEPVKKPSKPPPPPNKISINPPPAPNKRPIIPPAPKSDSDSEDDIQIIEEEEPSQLISEDQSSIPLIPLLDGLAGLLGLGYSCGYDVNQNESFPLLEETADLEDEPDSNSVNINTPSQWMGHQMIEDDEKARAAADDWDVGDLIPPPPPKRRRGEESDDSFAPSESDSSSDSNFEDNPAFPKPLRIRVYSPLVLPPTLPTATPPPWVSLQRMQPNPELTLAESRLQIEYKPFIPPPVIRGSYRKREPPGTLFQCPFCSSTSQTRVLLMDHVRSLHPTEPHEANGVPCPHCGKLYATTRLNQHIKLSHGGVKIIQKQNGASRTEFQCPHCPTKVVLEPNFIKHLAKHARREGKATEWGGKWIVK